jgi:hypothetical protein
MRCGAVALIVVPLGAPPQLCHDGEDLLDLVTTHEVGPLRISHTVSTYSNASESASPAAAAHCFGILTPAGAQRIAAVDEPPVP